MLPSPPPDSRQDGYGSDDGHEEAPNEFNALEVAARTGDLDTIKSICESDQLPNSTLECEFHAACTDALYLAIDNRHSELAEYLISQGVDFQIGHVVSALESRLDCLLPVFLAHGWDINQAESDFEPPLLAKVLDRPDQLKWFLEKGADPNAQCALETTPLSVAVERHPRHVVDLLFNSGGSVDAGQLLFHVCRRVRGGSDKIARMLLEKGCNIDAIESNKNCPFARRGTPLHEAIRWANLSMVKLLLSHGAKTSVPDTWGDLPIHRARRMFEGEPKRETRQILHNLMSHESAKRRRRA